MEKQEVWTREKVRDVLQELSKMEGFDCVPIPESIAKEYNIPFTPAKALSFHEYFQQYKKTLNTSASETVEVRPSDGIVRELRPAEPMNLIVCKTEEVDKYILKDGTYDETSSEPPQSQDTAKEDDTKENQEL